MIQYDEDTHCPKLLFCGHTFCTKCINNIFRSDHLKCPLCNREFPVASVDDLPKNFALLDLIQSNSVQVETADVSNPNGNEAQQSIPSQQIHGGVMDLPPAYDDVVKDESHKALPMCSDPAHTHGNCSACFFYYS